MARVRRVCIFCQRWNSGGIESFLSNILGYMDLSGIEIDIVVEEAGSCVFPEHLYNTSIRIQELSGSTLCFIKNYQIFAKLMDKRKYDILHLNVFQALSLVYLSLAKRKGIPIRIAHSHNTMLRKSRMWALKMVLHKIASKLFTKDATDLWACSNAAAKFMFPSSSLKEQKYHFIPNGIDLQRFRFDEKERVIQRKNLHLEGTFVIGNIGRLCYQKNQSFLLDIFDKIHRKVPSSRLLLVGEGEMFTKFQKKATSLGLDDDVIFYGTSNAVEKLLWAMDVFVFPSIFEGLGIVAIEAQAAGLPVICSDRVPPEALVTDLAQHLPLNATAEQWAENILATRGCRSKLDPLLQLDKHGFDIKLVSRQILLFYQQEISTFYK